MPGVLRHQTSRVPEFDTKRCQWLIRMDYDRMLHDSLQATKTSRFNCALCRRRGRLR